MSKPHDAPSPPPLRVYLATWLGLIVLLLITLGSAYIPMGSINVLLNLLIATAKTLLVMIFFMHLRTEQPIVRLAAAAGFFWFGFMIVLTLSDFLTR
jgi:cytochrome c oxidase subunit 4